VPFTAFEAEYELSVSASSNYDISLDGNDFLMVKRAGGTVSRQINVVLNWFEELKRLVPTN